MKQTQISTRSNNMGVFASLLVGVASLFGTVAHAADYTAITAAADWDDAIATFVVIGAALALAFVAIKGVRLVLKLLK